jgi:hypothetical protein
VPLLLGHWREATRRSTPCTFSSEPVNCRSTGLSWLQEVALRSARPPGGTAPRGSTRAAVGGHVGLDDLAVLDHGYAGAARGWNEEMATGDPRGRGCSSGRSPRRPRPLRASTRAAVASFSSGVESNRSAVGALQQRLHASATLSLNRLTAALRGPGLALEQRSRGADRCR